MKFLKLTKKNFEDWLTMGSILYKGYSREELRGEFTKTFRSKTEAVYICENDQGKMVGFIQLSLRKDYVQGSSSSPVGYIEGIYVSPKYRNSGIGKKLVEIGEKWSREKGCTEYGSDANFTEKESQKFHRKMGFKEVNKIVCYLKNIKKNRASKNVVQKEQRIYN